MTTTYHDLLFIKGAFGGACGEDANVVNVMPTRFQETKPQPLHSTGAV